VLALEYARGKTLREKVRALEGIRLNWFLTIVRSLMKLNRTGQLAYHGDLKPENVVVKPSGAVVLIDPALRIGRARRRHDHAALQPAAPARQQGRRDGHRRDALRDPDRASCRSTRCRGSTPAASRAARSSG
jgi:hypothetical protein